MANTKFGRRLGDKLPPPFQNSIYASGWVNCHQNFQHQYKLSLTCYAFLWLTLLLVWTFHVIGQELGEGV